MDVLIAGCGWLGQEVARRLVGRGDRVTGLTRTAASAARLRLSGIAAVAVDLAEPNAGRLLSGRYDGIVAAQSASGGDASDYRRAYVEATRNLLDADAAQGAVFVCVGSTGVFGQSDGGFVDERTEPMPVDATSRVLLEAERQILDRSSRGAKALLVRCSGLYGPGRAGTIERVRRGSLALGDGEDAWMNFIHRDDAADTVIAALDRGRPGAAYHASDAHPAQRREVVAWIAARLGIAPHRLDTGVAAAGRRGTNRRIDSHATRAELGVRLEYPSFREGFAPLLG